MSPQYASEDQIQAVETAVLEGIAPDVAARKVGTTLSAIKRIDPHRHGDLIARGREVRRAVVDERMDELAKADDPNPTVVVAWAKANHEGYRDTTKLEISGTLEHEHNGRFSLVELAALIKERGIDKQLEDGSRPLPGVPAAREILPGAPERTPGDLPAA